MTAESYRVDARRLEDFSALELHDLLKMRVDVFVVEQKCPYPEIDGKDKHALHLRLMQDNDLLAAARIFAPAEAAGPAKIGRVVVSPAHRGKRLGDAVMREAITLCEERFPACTIALSAQSHLKAFYASFGFEACSAEYLEDGIPHVDMFRPTKVAVN
ncbi:GCN5-related N-acetyltransferase [Rhizobium sp. PDO1-076]|mgnify:CR=1 FL=1|uniref:GNAT family N-acetyltransferase n=1 Tax=Rhizobium sp. PDO1-076 TaxID=1125979 RepID=UPI00024E235D|nr:GNAT family N-acetyltransferase [Rhizobium sp. PDO1-076]EHS53227.1 GCN5-related N-acetyltransferase [Rhizobium sp. PDO1-076]